MLQEERKKQQQQQPRPKPPAGVCKEGRVQSRGEGRLTSRQPGKEEQGQKADSQADLHAVFPAALQRRHWVPGGMG